MGEEATALRRRADYCRRLAEWVTNADTRTRLLTMAADYDARADALDETPECPNEMPPPAQH